MNRVTQIAVLLLGVVILVVGASLFSSAAANQTDPSSTANDKAGTLALYTWLDELGMPTSRIQNKFALDNIDTLIIAEPTKSFTTPDIATVDAFLKRGGNVIVADEQGESAPLLRNYSITLSPGFLDGTAHYVGDIGSQADVHNVPVSGAGTVSAELSARLLTLDGQVVAAVFPTGGGAMIVVTSELPFSNEGLRQQDSAKFVLALLELSRGPRVGFDEFHHGASGATSFLGPGLGDIFSGPLGLATLLGIVFTMFALAANGRRLGKPVKSGDAAKVPSAVDRIADLTELFERAGDRGPIVARYVDELKQQVAERTGVRATVSDDEFVASLTAGPVDETRTLLSEGRKLEQSRPTSAAMAKYAQDIVTLERTWANR
jgi:hypothetical protein